MTTRRRQRGRGKAGHVPAGGITDEIAARAWLASTCPHIWGLLAEQAQRKLPPGLAPPWTQDGLPWLTFADAQVGALSAACGERAVRDTYRRDLSRATTAARVMELISEVSVCTALAALPATVRLRPSTGRGTYSDVAFERAGVTAYAEVKRYEDRWFSRGDPTRGRAAVKAPPGSPTMAQADRPRSMELVSKLRDVPRQLPAATANILFVYHPSFGDSYRYVQAALFGDRAWLAAPGGVGAPEADGLFAADEWRRVSACYLTHVDPTLGTWFPVGWSNPRADAPLPADIQRTLAAVREPRAGR